MAFCVKCGAQLEEGAGFCTNCGSAQNEGGQQAPQMQQSQGGMQTAPQMQQAPQPPKKSRKGLIIGIFLGGVALAAGLVVLILFLTGVIGGGKGGGGETVIAGGTGSTGTTSGGTGGTTTIAGTDEPVTNVSVGAEYELVYMSMWGGKASEEDIEVMFPLGIWLKMTPDSANSGTALFNNGGGEGEWKYTIDGNRLHMDDGYSTIDAVIRDGFVLFEEPLDTSFNYCFADETADKALVSEIKDGDTNPFDPAFDFTAGGSASGGGSSQGASGNTAGAETDFGYDFETAKQYIGDYQGMVVFEDQVTMAGYDWSNYYRAVYARIVIDEEGEPQVFLRSDLMDSHNFGHTDAWFEEDGTLMMEGILADTEWYDLVFPPENGIIEIWGRIGEPSENKKNFTVLLKPLDETWDRSELPDLIADDQLDTLNRNITNLGDLTLEELLQAVEQHRANKAKENGAEITEETKYTMLTDELPDAYLLELYQ
ncbi:MAG: zinc ribbon domain-containing protein [Lachnospiraceae bacterium]|nr:zinc ribbon domain-containing protein [Lachnospiraceae bacterium]